MATTGEPIELTQGKLSHDLTAEVYLHQTHIDRFRMWLGTGLMQLACWVLGFEELAVAGELRETDEDPRFVTQRGNF